MSNSNRRPASESQRGVTSILNYALLLVIVSLVVAGLFVGVSTLMEDQRKQAIRSELETVGNRLAADIGTADRLVRTANTSTSTEIQLRSQLPETVAGSQYIIEIKGLGDNRYELTLRSVDPAVEASVVVRSTVGVDMPAGAVSGDRLVISYDSADGRLEVTHD